jgi:hypothetical protein
MTRHRVPTGRSRFAHQIGAWTFVPRRAQAPNAPIVRRKKITGHPMPIAPAAGERFSATRFSLTGADSSCAAPRRSLCVAPPSEKRSTLPCVILSMGEVSY